MAVVSKKIKMPGLTRKAVLKDTVGRRLPPALFKMPKKGFTIPLREWFKDDIYQEALSNISMARFGLKENVINEVIEENRSGKRDFGNFIWMLLLLDRWVR